MNIFKLEMEYERKKEEITYNGMNIKERNLMDKLFNYELYIFLIFIILFFILFIF